MKLHDVPHMQRWLTEMPMVYWYFTIATAVAIVIVLLLTMKQLYNVHYFISEESIQSKVYYIMLVPLVVSIICFVANLVPRTAGILFAVGLTYLMVCLHSVFRLIVKLFGGIAAFSRYLTANNIPISFNTPPFCCCCKCLPTVKPSRRNLNRLSRFVIQTPIVRIFIEVVTLLMIIEGVDEKHWVIQTLHTIGIVSMLIAIYTCHILVQMTKEKLSPYGMIALFRMVDLSQGLYSAQKFIFDTIAKNGGVEDSVLLPAPSKGIFWHNVAMIFLMTIFAIVIFALVRPGNSRIFDLHEQDDGAPRVYEAQLDPQAIPLQNHGRNHNEVSSL